MTRSSCLTKSITSNTVSLALVHQNGPQLNHRSSGRHQAGANLPSYQPPFQEKGVPDLKTRPGGGNLPGWSRFAAYQRVSRPRSLIVVEKETGVEMKNVLVEPSTECPVMLTSYETKKTHVGVLATPQEVAVACPIA